MNDSKLTRETLQRLAREQARLTLDETRVDDLLKLVNGLQAFAAEGVERSREGVEPMVALALEDWPHD